MATNDLLLTKLFSEGGTSESWLDWDSVKSLPLEQALSRLTRWILICHNAGMTFGLRMENQRVLPGSGDTHKHQCLTLLAKYKLPNTRERGSS
jgi:hypothetical protein